MGRKKGGKNKKNKLSTENNIVDKLKEVKEEENETQTGDQIDLEKEHLGEA